MTSLFNIEQLCDALKQERKTTTWTTSSIDRDETQYQLVIWRNKRKERNDNNNNKRTKTNQTTIAKRYEVAQSTVSKINKIITNLFTIGNNNNKTTTKKKKNNNLSSNQQQQQQIKILEQNLQDKQRGGDNELRARRRKLGSNDGEIAGYVRTAAAR